MSLIEIGDFDAIRKTNAVAKPIESIGQNNFALGTCGNFWKFNDGLNDITDF